MLASTTSIYYNKQPNICCHSEILYRDPDTVTRAHVSYLPSSLSSFNANYQTYHSGRYLVEIKTENGFVGHIDIGDEIEEQAYLKANPDVERSQGFLSLMAQMDFADAEKFLKGEDGMGQGPLSPHVRYDFGGQTAMHMAAYNDDVEGIQLLLGYGADRACKDEDGQTALDCAKAADAKRVVALLEIR